MPIQNNQNENIPILAIDSTTQISISATYLGKSANAQIGGMRYSWSSTLTCNLATVGAGGLDTGSLASNTLYYIYLISSNNLPYLIASTANPITGPTNFNSHISKFKYIGYFRTNASSQVFYIQNGQVGADIRGVAVTDWAQIREVTNCSWVLGTGASDVVNTVKMRRIGDCADFLVSFAPNASWAGDADQLKFKLPTGYTINTSKQIYASDRSFFGTGELLDESDSRKSYKLIVKQDETDNQYIEVFYVSTTSTLVNLTSSAPITMVAGDSILLELKGIPISGWSSNDMYPSN